MDTTDRNRQLIRDLLTATDAGEPGLVRSFFAPDYVDHDPSEARRGPSHAQALEQAFEVFRAAFTDVRHTLHDTVVEGDRIAARISAVATHTGTVFGIPPTGRTIENDSIVIYRIVDGKIVERWCRERFSTRELLRQAARGDAGPVIS